MVLVFCTVTKGDLPLKFSWELNGKAISTIQGISVTTMNKRASQLSIDDVQSYHAGSFRCIAENKAGNTSYSADLLVNGRKDVASIIECQILFLFLPIIPTYITESAVILVLI